MVLFHVAERVRYCPKEHLTTVICALPGGPSAVRARRFRAMIGLWILYEDLIEATEQWRVSRA
jgi:hypothetical protein